MIRILPEKKYLSPVVILSNKKEQILS